MRVYLWEVAKSRKVSYSPFMSTESKPIILKRPAEERGRADAAGTGKPITVPASPAMPHAWVQVISGEVTVLGETLGTADGLAIEDAPDGFDITPAKESKFLVFRLS